MLPKDELRLPLLREVCGEQNRGQGLHVVWGAHAPRVPAMAPSPSRTFPSRSVAARAPQMGTRGRVRSPS
jgi:hypothetical protein